jgi:ribosome-associated translation inhibitor RaiA
MSENPAVVISFKDLVLDERLRESLEQRCHDLTIEFPEVTRVELTLNPDGDDCSAHGRATGKDTEVATRASADEIGVAADQVLDKLKQKLRRSHDKRIFSHRRVAKQTHPRRS